MPLKDVALNLTTDLIVQKTQIVARALKKYFNIQEPAMVVAGLNPHAGEQGMFGQEEAQIIIPAIDALKTEGFNIKGPVAADSLFHEKARQNYDVALCMYHDQALIPVKMLGFDKGVNVTLGLPFLRTSPDHGTAFDIVGQNKANAESLIEAVKLQVS